MKRWISSVACVALFTGAAFGQACDKAQTCDKSATAVKLVKAESCDKAQSCDKATATVTAVKATKADSSCCSQGTSTAAAIIAASVTSDKTCSANTTCTKGAEVIAASLTSDDKTCSAATTCTKGAEVIAASLTDDKACSGNTTCTKGAEVIAATFTDDKACSAATTCTKGAEVIAASLTNDDKTCTLGGPTCTGVATPVAAKVCPITGKPFAETSLVSYQTAVEKTAPCCEDGKGECCTEGKASTVAMASDKSLNKVCPMTGMPITEAGLVKYEGKTLGFCGAGCAAKFNAADADQQAKVYNTILASQPVAGTPSLEVMEVPLSQLKSDPYTLNTCAVSGGKLGEMGEPITKVINGREVKFCCGGCVPQYEADPAKFNAKIDAMLIKQQLPYYPAQTCAVAGTPLMADGKDIGKNIIVNNRLVRVCCAKCEAKLKADPTAFFAKLDKAVIAKQTKDYPLETCIVRDSSQLGAMGEPIELVSGNRLVKFCCAGCVEKFKANPAAYIAKLDKAWQTKHPEMFKVAKAEPVTIKATPIISAGG